MGDFIGERGISFLIQFLSVFGPNIMSLHFDCVEKLFGGMLHSFDWLLRSDEVGLGRLAGKRLVITQLIVWCSTIVEIGLLICAALHHFLCCTVLRFAGESNGGICQFIV